MCSIVYGGLDVHHESITAYLLHPDAAEIINRRFAQPSRLMSYR